MHDDLAIKSFYDSSDAYFEILENRDELNFKNVIDVVNQYIPRGTQLLEFGCGTGNLAHLICKNGYSVLGVDISERFIEHAQQKYVEQNGHLRYQVVGFGKLPFSDKSFDCIYTCAVLEHCYEVDKIITDLDRLLKPGGIMILYTPNMISPFARVGLILKRVTGKRHKFHLYGSPGFLIKSIWYCLKKSISEKPDFIYVEPNYQKFNEADEDVTFLSNHYDYIHLLQPMNYKMLELSRGSSKVGKIIAKVFPKLSGEVLIVARKC